MKSRIVIASLLLVLAGCGSDSSTSSSAKLAIARVSGNEQTGRTGRSLASPLVVLVTNVSGQPVANQRVDFAITEGTGRLTVESTLSDDVGRASTQLILGGEEGKVVVQAKVFGSDDAVIFTATAITVTETPDSTSSVPSVSLEIPTEGLAAFYPFNGNANDESGNGNEGESHGAVLGEDRFGDPTGAYLFDGQNDYIVTSKPIGISGNAPRTVSAWVNVTDLNDDTAIIYWGTQDHAAGLNGVWASEQLYSKYSLLRFRGHYQDIDSGPSNTIKFGKWQQIAFTYNGNVGVLYVDGAMVTAGGLDLQTDDTAVSFGINLHDEGINVPLNRFYHGALDDVRIYRVALSGAEIEALYQERGWGAQD